MKPRSLEGLNALVTGASHGIGMASALHLARDGATVTITGRQAGPLEKARERIMIQVPGARIETCSGDACDSDSIEKAVNFAHDLEGRLDILVTTVGGARFTKLVDETPAGARNMFELNFISVFLAVHHALPKMHREGSVVCISTSAVNLAYNALSMYSASKAALERFVKSAAYELGRKHIRINAVRPGVTLSETAINERGVADMVASYNAKVPLGRIGLPEDIASAVRFLAGPESSYITGQIFSADGGQDQCRAPEFVEMDS